MSSRKTLSPTERDRQSEVKAKGKGGALWAPQKPVTHPRWVSQPRDLWGRVRALGEAGRAAGSTEGRWRRWTQRSEALVLGESRGGAAGLRLGCLLAGGLLPSPPCGPVHLSVHPSLRPLLCLPIPLQLSPWAAASLSLCLPCPPPLALPAPAATGAAALHPPSPTRGLTAPEPRLPTEHPYCTSKRDGEVHLRQEDAFTSQAPITVHDMVMNTAIKYANYIALGSKHRNGWHLLTYIEYYEECRRAAKAFLKVPRVLLRLRARPPFCACALLRRGHRACAPLPDTIPTPPLP